MDDFLGISIVGAIVSFIIQYTKKWAETTGWGSKFVAIGTSIVIGTVYYALRQTGWLETTLGILASASTVYAFILKESNPA